MTSSPLKTDGFRYTDASYLQAWNTRTFHVPDLADYDRILTDHNVVARINSGQIDEVLVWGAPGFGYFESRMAGPNAYWVNSPGMPQVQSVRKFIVMGLNYERTFDFALHSYGHRVESILDHVYRPASGSDWDLFNNYHATSPGSAGVGSIHFPPNGRNNYDYENPAFVPSTAIDWKMNWPNLSGTTALVNNANWTSSHGGLHGLVDGPSAKAPRKAVWLPEQLVEVRGGLQRLPREPLSSARPLRRLVCMTLSQHELRTNQRTNENLTRRTELSVTEHLRRLRMMRRPIARH